MYRSSAHTPRPLSPWTCPGKRMCPDGILRTSGEVCKRIQLCDRPPQARWRNGLRSKGPFCLGTVGFFPTQLLATTGLIPAPAGLPFPKSLPSGLRRCVCSLLPPLAPLSRTPGRLAHLAACFSNSPPEGTRRGASLRSPLWGVGHFQSGALTDNRRKNSRLDLCCECRHTGLSGDTLPFLLEQDRR